MSDDLLLKMREKEPEAIVTFHPMAFPMEHQYIVHVWGKPLGDFKATKEEALKSAIDNLYSTDKEV